MRFGDEGSIKLFIGVLLATTIIIMLMLNNYIALFFEVTQSVEYYMSNNETFLRDFVVIPKRPLQNQWKTLFPLYYIDKFKYSRTFGYVLPVANEAKYSSALCN